MYIRGWSATDHPGGVAFVDELRAVGIEVVDVYVPPAGFTDLAGWARAAIEMIDGTRIPGQPLHLLAYCVGGNLSLEVVRQLEAREEMPEYVGFIDVREDQESYRLSRGLDGLYQVPWGVRLRLLLVRLTPPDRETFGAVLESVMRRAVRSLREFPSRGWRSRKRRKPNLFAALHLPYSWEFRRIVTPVHCYNSPSTIARYSPRDPSMNIGQYLSGGYCIRSIEGDHEHCLDPPHAAGLIELIEAVRSTLAAR